MNYYSVLLTDYGIAIEDKERFEREVAELNAVTEDAFNNAFEYIELEYSESDEEWVLDIRGTEGASLDLYCDALPDVLNKFPPDDWTDAQKEAHARTFNYPMWISAVATDDTLDVVGFLQRHIKPGSYAVIKGVAHEGLRDCSAWVCVFTKDQCEHSGLWKEADRLVNELGINRSKESP